jgi:hypothetical protein
VFWVEITLQMGMEKVRVWRKNANAARSGHCELDQHSVNRLGATNITFHLLHLLRLFHLCEKLMVEV